jgi:hypothetical protein
MAITSHAASMISHLSEDCRGEICLHSAARSAALALKARPNQHGRTGCTPSGSWLICSGQGGMQAARDGLSSVHLVAIGRDLDDPASTAQRPSYLRPLVTMGSPGRGRPRACPRCWSVPAARRSFSSGPDIQPRSLTGAWRVATILDFHPPTGGTHEHRHARSNSGEPGTREHNRAPRCRSRGGDRTPVLAVPA